MDGRVFGDGVKRGELYGSPDWREAAATPVCEADGLFQGFGAWVAGIGIPPLGVLWQKAA